MSCPNRDGTVSYGGCIFCSKGGSGDFAAPYEADMEHQIAYAKQLVSSKSVSDRYIAYFQSFTNTYADVDYLRNLYMPVILRDDIAVLSIGTRPDCLEDDKIALIKELAHIKPVWVELGLQTIHQKTADLINRGYPLKCYDLAVKNLKNAGAEVITHMIVGLPHETHDEMIETARYIGSSGSDGIKIQLLHILKDTALYEMYQKGDIQTLTEEEYIQIVADILSVLPENMVIHRLTGDGDKKILAAPLWSCNKRKVLNGIHRELSRRAKKNDVD